MKKLYTLEEAARELGLSYQILRREALRGKLQAKKFGGRIYVFGEDLDLYIKGCTISPSVLMSNAQEGA